MLDFTDYKIEELKEIHNALAILRKYEMHDEDMLFAIENEITSKESEK